MCVLRPGHAHRWYQSSLSRSKYVLHPGHLRPWGLNSSWSSDSEPVACEGQESVTKLCFETVHSQQTARNTSCSVRCSDSLYTRRALVCLLGGKLGTLLSPSSPPEGGGYQHWGSGHRSKEGILVCWLYPDPRFEKTSHSWPISLGWRLTNFRRNPLSSCHGVLRNGWRLTDFRRNSSLSCHWEVHGHWWRWYLHMVFTCFTSVCMAKIEQTVEKHMFFGSQKRQK